MKYDVLREAVCEANRALGRSGLVMLTFGNVSGADLKGGVMAIKPSGVDFGALRPRDMVVVSLDSGEVKEGALRPSSDTPAHLHLYRTLEGIEGVVHTHSHYATVWAQARKPLPCFGTTHADYFHGEVPVTRELGEAEVLGDYELNMGRVIAERFAEDQRNPSALPAVLVAGHGPFTFGADPEAALENALVLEEAARMAFHALLLEEKLEPIPRFLLDRHFQRKHGKTAYYGQA